MAACNEMAFLSFKNHPIFKKSPYFQKITLFSKNPLQAITNTNTQKK
jgi:hypothetical protein